MKKAFTFGSIGLITLMLFVSNSVVATASYGNNYSPALSDATYPGEIVGADDGEVCSVGEPGQEDGIIVVRFNYTFSNGPGTTDVTVYGLNPDSITEGYDVGVGNYVDEYTPIEMSYIGSSDDNSGTVIFSMGDLRGTYDVVVIVTQDGEGDEGSLPGAEIDAVYVHYGTVS